MTHCHRHKQLQPRRAAKSNAISLIMKTHSMQPVAPYSNDGQIDWCTSGHVFGQHVSKGFRSKVVQVLNAIHDSSVEGKYMTNDQRAYTNGTNCPMDKDDANYGAWLEELFRICQSVKKKFLYHLATEWNETLEGYKAKFPDEKVQTKKYKATKDLSVEGKSELKSSLGTVCSTLGKTQNNED